MSINILSKQFNINIQSINEFHILIASGKRVASYSSLDGNTALTKLLLLTPVDEVLGLKMVGIIGISTCLFRILYNMIPLGLLQVFLCCSAGQERLLKRLVTLIKPY